MPTEPAAPSASPANAVHEGCGSDGAPVRIAIGPELDLHAFHPRDIRSCVDEFIREAVAAGLPQLRLIHGRGRGVQRGIVQDALEHHPDVVEFWDDTSAHLGAIYARLRQPARV